MCSMGGDCNNEKMRRRLTAVCFVASFLILSGCQSTHAPEPDGYFVPVEIGSSISCGNADITVREYTITALECDSTVYGLLVYKSPPELESLTTFNYLCSEAPFTVETQFKTIMGAEFGDEVKGTETTDGPKEHTYTDTMEVNGRLWYVLISEDTFFPAETVVGYPPGPAPFYSEDPIESFAYYMGLVT